MTQWRTGQGRSQDYDLVFELAANNNTQTVYTSDRLGLRHVVGSIDLAAIATAGTVVTVKVEERIDGANYIAIDSIDFTVGTTLYHPHWDFYTPQYCRVTIKLDVAEGDARDLPVLWRETPQV